MLLNRLGGLGIRPSLTWTCGPPIGMKMRLSPRVQAVFRRLLPRRGRRGYKSAIWAIAHRLCRVVWKILHEGVRYIEQGSESDPKVRKQRARSLARALRKLGYQVAITPINPATTEKAVQV